MTITASDDDQLEAAMVSLFSHKGDRIARALDRLGWMIVPQPRTGPGETHWRLYSQPCPTWAEYKGPPSHFRNPPKLRLVEGGKDDTP